MYTVDINNPDSIYTVYLNSADEDYINFGTFENFTNSSDWCVIEKLKCPQVQEVKVDGIFSEEKLGKIKKVILQFQ